MAKQENPLTGEAQVFCDRLFQAFGHAGYKEAGARLEYRVKRKGESTKYADLFWESRLLLEMKKQGEKLEKHYGTELTHPTGATLKQRQLDGDMQLNAYS